MPNPSCDLIILPVLGFKLSRPLRILVAITGASGALYAQRLLDNLDPRQHELHVVQSKYAQAVISELLETLDLERGGELARGLMQIYEYMNHRLVEANLHKDVAPAREVERLLRELLPAWEQAARESTTRPVRHLAAAV